MLIESNLPKTFWGEASVTATYLINRSPAKALQGKTPEEIWTNKIPDLRHLKVFGCLALAHIPKERRDKWDPKAKRMIFTGYDDDIKGYRLIDPDTLLVVKYSRDVTFFENEFPI